jgi:hypothetical protein
MASKKGRLPEYQWNTMLGVREDAWSEVLDAEEALAKLKARDDARAERKAARGRQDQSRFTPGARRARGA